MTGPVLLRAADRRTGNWKNGGGTTSEVLAFPPDAGVDGFEWRVSIAEIAATAPFSRFENVDRTLLVLEGAVSLHGAGEPATTRLEAMEMHRFPGEAALVGTPIGGRARDLNVMVARDRWRAEVDLIRAGAGGSRERLTGPAMLVFTGAGAARSRHADLELAPLDALYVGDPAGLAMTLDSACAIVRIAFLPVLVR